MTIFDFFLVAVTVCGCNRTNNTTPLSKATEEKFKSKVNEYYKMNGWGSGPDSWEHFDVASITTDWDGRLIFQQAVENVEKSIDSWTMLRGKNEMTPPFSQGLTRLLGASTLIYLAREKKLSDLKQDDRNQLLDNAKKLLEKITLPDDPNVIFLFEQAVDVCQQQFTLSPGSDDSSLKNRALCYRKNIDMIQGLWVAEMSLSPEDFEVINDLYNNIFRITSLATQAHVSAEEKTEKLYPELHRIYNSLQNVLKLFLAAPAVNIQGRNMQAVELATTARGKLAKVEENLSDLIQKHNSNSSNALDLEA